MNKTKDILMAEVRYERNNRRWILLLSFCLINTQIPANVRGNKQIKNCFVYLDILKKRSMIIESRAYARAGLLGNPSDGYFGKTISITVKNFGAIVTLYETPELHIEESEAERSCFRNIYQLTESIRQNGYYGGRRLIKAAIKKFSEYCDAESVRLPNRNFTIRYSTSIPRQVGLAGSSAIITSTMKALMSFYEVDIPQHLLSTLIWKVEKEELGILGGLQDRVIQVYEGCVYMDFEQNFLEKEGYGHYESLDPALLPKFYLAYKTDLSKVSGKVFNNLQERFEQKDPHTLKILGELADVARQGRDAILDRNHSLLNELIDHNFDLRCKILNISEPNLELVRVARSCGASAKFSGSGGAIIGMYHDNDTLNKLVVRLRDLNAKVIKPYII